MAVYILKSGTRQHNHSITLCRKGKQMIGKLIVVIGILIVAIGTIFSLWTILTTSKKDYGTAGWFDRQHIEFAKEKNRVFFGTILIVLGSLLQIVGTLL